MISTSVESMGIRMKHTIASALDWGLVIRAVRKSVQLRQDDLAGIAGVSGQFAVDVEKGKPTVQLGRVLLLQELGIPLQVDIPDKASHYLLELKSRADGIPPPPLPGRSKGE